MQNINEQIENFKKFIEQYYEKKLHELNSKGISFVYIDFFEVAEFSPELAEFLLENPEDAIKSLELAISEFDVNLRARIFNLPKSQYLDIRNIRSKHLDKFVYIEGIVRQASDVRPQVVSAKFECPVCGNNISILQLDTKFKEPYRCSCGNKGRFRLLSKDLVDAQRLVIEESPENLEGGEQSKRLPIYLKEDLVEPKMEKKTTPGSKVRINGVIKEVSIILKTGVKSINYDLSMDANSIIPIEETFEEIEISKEEEEKIKELSKDPLIYEKLTNSIAPSIYGHEKIKEAIVLQLMSGVRKVKDDGTVIRGDMHILLVGDPGAAKSSLLQFVSKAAPKARFISGKGSSGAGLCVAPDSLVLTNPSGVIKAQDFVESNLKDNEQLYCEGVYKTKNQIKNKYVWSFDKNLKLQSKSVKEFWKIKSPEYLYNITLRSGKNIIITTNTQLYSIDNGKLIWKKSSEFKVGDYLATTRKLSDSKIHEEVSLFNLIDQNPLVHNVKSKIDKILKKLSKKYTKREIAKKLDYNENNLYHNWIKEGARGNIHLKDYKKLLNFAGKKIDENLTLPLYNGKKFRLPNKLSNDFMYLLGLVAGDGDLSNTNNNFSIRLSNSSPQLIEMFEKIVKELFNQKCNITKGNEKRPTSIRFNNKILFKILNKLGIPQSPKSNKIDISNYLFNLPNEKIGYFLSGLYDTNGSVSKRKTNNYNIELTTASENLARKVQLLLLRFGILSFLRKRRPSPNEKIKNKLDQYKIFIYEKENLEKFRDNINFYKEEKRRKLLDGINEISYSHTNLDLIPNISYLLEEFRNKNKKILKEIFNKQILRYLTNKNRKISTNYLKKIIFNLENKKVEQIQELSLLANSDILWDKITDIKFEKSPYEYLYDLTVEDSHSFLVNGILVHNTASVIKDEFIRGWALEAGALVLASGGLAAIDEFDKMTTEDRSAMHQAMEQQFISIAKANIQATLRAQTSVLAAANPKLGRFDPYSPIAAQIDLPPTLINRFDLIFTIRDIPNKERDEKIASHVLELQKRSGKIESEIDPKLLRKYIAYAKQNIKPILTDGAVDEIKKFYVDLRNKGQSSEEEIRPIPISARQLEALVRLAEASAKVRLSKEVKRKDAKRAIEILTYCLLQVGIDPETGKIDIDRISTGITATQRSRIVVIREIIRELESKHGKSIPMEAIIEEASKKGYSEDQIEEAIEKLKREAEVFSPKQNFVSRL